MKINVSSETFNEIFQALQKEGKELKPGIQITIEKTDELSQPVDFVLAKKRFECLEQAVNLVKDNHDDVIKVANEMYDFVINGSKQKGGWK